MPNSKSNGFIYNATFNAFRNIGKAADLETNSSILMLLEYLIKVIVLNNLSLYTYRLVIYSNSF